MSTEVKRWRGFWAWWVLGSIGDLLAIASDVFENWSSKYAPVGAGTGTEPE